jgi:hypothetical protein
MFSRALCPEFCGDILSDFYDCPKGAALTLEGSSAEKTLEAKPGALVSLHLGYLQRDSWNSSWKANHPTQVLL